MNRRRFLAASALVVASAPYLRAKPETPERHIATNVYPWMTFYKRQQRDWSVDVDAGLAEIVQSGVHGFEPIADSAKQVRELGPLLVKHQLEMRSLYVNSRLHESADAAASIDTVIETAMAAKELGTKIIVTNPSPIRWGGPEDKSDTQLREQARNLNALGERLRAAGMTLAYHNHDAELRAGGREFHHMLTATDPENVKLCLDSHWIFRGCGNSQVALFDALAHYHERIVELHLRQSSGGFWNEAFTMDGDIDYTKIFELLDQWKLKPLMVLEQAVEAQSP
ncbi:MAG: sugar phosphate isomerase/epimerase, partial [Verrucomicrobia bacterium]|nr:sugar phosphate isomerase/epimerase [Verrucomicrobiota bacterium]